jgi:hypothetical protein
MPAFFFKFTIMSWQIPTQIEQDIIAGKAQHTELFKPAMGGQSGFTGATKFVCRNFWL